MSQSQEVTRLRVIKKISQYSPSEFVYKLLGSARVLLVVGISGAGKNYVIQKLLESGKYHYAISYTTREPRMNHGVMEKNKEHYNFISWEQAEAMIDGQEFVEAKIVHENNLYATGYLDFQIAKNNNMVAVTDIDIQGAQEFVKFNKGNIKTIFLVPADFDLWHSRLVTRYQGSGDHTVLEINNRMRTAVWEIETALKDKKNFAFVVNDDIDKTIEDINELVDSDWESLDFIDGEEAASRLVGKIKEKIITTDTHRSDLQRESPS
ncbi:hypothetical protein DYH10_00390 [Candidatus Saccharibacteria bacterium CPR2]|nr:hypothetical protein [Candidatus Saccharibacteria bacterium CPR2]